MNKNIQLLYVTLIILLTSTIVFTQAISGEIVDAKNNPIEGAIIYNKKELHTHSNLVGKFTLQVDNDSDTLTVHYLGYKTIKIPVNELSDPAIIIMKESPFLMEQVQVSAKSDVYSDVAKIDIINRPVKSSQEILTRVPGIFIAQHAGGGKAEQIFLRGFDLDHGTDINISVDGMPVNMVSHAHGQGYADLHFVIPETIEKIDFGKGPYATNQGNFATAGFVNFNIKDELKKSVVGLEVGAFNTRRMLTLIDLTANKSKKVKAFVGSEYLLSDGPFVSPQGFHRWNNIGKIVLNPNDQNKIALTLTAFSSEWDASGQIPQRLVDNGTISRFGSVDDTEGGKTSRFNAQIAHTKFLSNDAFVKTSAYFTKYNFELYSNFTFFLEDEVNGDQIRQKEDRNIYGLNSSYFKSLDIDLFDLNIEYNVGLRVDDISNNELSHTANRIETLERYALGDIMETNMFTYLDAEVVKGKFLLNTGLRLDYFNFEYLNKLDPKYSKSSYQKTLASPKASLYYNHSKSLQLYLKSGVGFHSNDTRAIAGFSNNSISDIVPKAFGSDLGFVWKPFKKVWLNAAAWILRSNQEFTYVGDAGIVEPNGRSERKGLDLSVRYQLASNLFFDTDINYSIPRALDVEIGESDIIPLAPRLTSSGGVSYKSDHGFTVGARYRYIDDRPASSDGSVVAKGYFVADFNATYAFKNVTLGFIVDNVFNTAWNEAQFATTSRLLNESAPVEELHFTPGAPRNMRVRLQYGF